MNEFEKARQNSTCQKRITICEIYDKEGVLLACESNRCDPSGGTCHRLGLVQSKEGYDVTSHCNWTHAEVMTIGKLKEGDRPYRSVIHGHDFYCDSCEEALRRVGVEVLEIGVRVITK
jgi:hypothetical protein